MQYITRRKRIPFSHVVHLSQISWEIRWSRPNRNIGTWLPFMSISIPMTPVNNIIHMRRVPRMGVSVTWLLPSPICSLRPWAINPAQHIRILKRPHILNLHKAVGIIPFNFTAYHPFIPPVLWGEHHPCAGHFGKLKRKVMRTSDSTTISVNALLFSIHFGVLWRRKSSGKTRASHK